MVNDMETREKIAYWLYNYTDGVDTERQVEDEGWLEDADQILAIIKEANKVPVLPVLSDENKAAIDLENHNLPCNFTSRRSYFVGCQAQRDDCLRRLQGEKK